MMIFILFSLQAENARARLYGNVLHEKAKSDI